MRGAWLEALTWSEARARFADDPVVVVPIGAAAKAHGPHLPLKTDALTARALGQGLIERLPVVAAPVLGFGFYPAFTRFAGSQHLGADIFKSVVRELVAGLRVQGVRRVALVNTGVSTEQPLEEVSVWHVGGGGPASHQVDVVGVDHVSIGTDQQVNTGSVQDYAL